MTNEADPSALLREVGALMDGHFRLSSGRHSPVYVEKFRLLQDPKATERLCRLIADRFRDDRPSPAPPVGHSRSRGCDRFPRSH